jgi:NADH-quinone oxidoreductase subunit E
MNDTNGQVSCAVVSWAMAVGAGFLAFVLLMLLGDWRFMQAVFASAVIVVALGFVFSLLFCSPLPKHGEARAPTAKPEQPTAAPAPVAAPVAESPQHDPVAEVAIAPEPTPEPTAPEPTAPEPTAPEPTAPEPTAPEPEAEPAPEPVNVSAPAASDDQLIKPSQPLAGQAELASRKGSWTYTPDPEPQPKAAAPVTEAAAEKPELLDSPPEDGGDDIKQIKGIGPKMEKLCNSLGIYRFAQIASWSDAEVAWVDANLEGFKGRVVRDEWVAQAQILAAGGSTDFAKKVEDGGIY